MTDALALTNVGLSLTHQGKDLTILHDISLTIGDSERVAIMGPSGSGKTSLLMVAGGLEQATAGTVSVHGQNITAMSEPELAAFRRSHLGIIFQDFHLIGSMRAWENVATTLEMAGVKDAKERALAMLDKVDLSHRAFHFAHELSGGEQQRVAIARACVNHPSLLLADEPTGNLDEATGKMIIELMFSLQKEHGNSLLMVTHDPDLAKQCNRIVTILDGTMESIAHAEKQAKSA